jgi:hypothetical protein
LVIVLFSLAGNSAAGTSGKWIRALSGTPFLQARWIFPKIHDRQMKLGHDGHRQARSGASDRGGAFILPIS